MKKRRGRSRFATVDRHARGPRTQPALTTSVGVVPETHIESRCIINRLGVAQMRQHRNVLLVRASEMDLKKTDPPGRGNPIFVCFRSAVFRAVMQNTSAFPDYYSAVFRLAPFRQTCTLPCTRDPPGLAVGRVAHGTAYFD